MPIVVKGLLQTRSALRKFAPDILKESDREMRAALQVIVKQARSFVPRETPMQNWDSTASSTQQGAWAGARAFSAPIIKAGIRSKIGGGKVNSRGFRSVYSIINETAAGAIYETAGRKTAGQQGSSNNPRAGQKFIANIQNQADMWTPVGQPHGKGEGRLVYAAVERNRGKAMRTIAIAVGISVEKFNVRVAGGGLK